MTDDERRELRRAAVVAHEMHSGNDDIEVANYDDEESFVEKVQGGFWVEARVWVPDEEMGNDEGGQDQ